MAAGTQQLGGQQHRFARRHHPGRYKRIRHRRHGVNQIQGDLRFDDEQADAGGFTQAQLPLTGQGGIVAHPGQLIMRRFRLAYPGAIAQRFALERILSIQSQIFQGCLVVVLPGNDDHRLSDGLLRIGLEAESRRRGEAELIHIPVGLHEREDLAEGAQQAGSTGHVLA